MRKVEGVARRYHVSLQKINESIMQALLRDYSPGPSRSIFLVPQPLEGELERSGFQMQLMDQGDFLRSPISSLAKLMSSELLVSSEIRMTPTHMVRALQMVWDCSELLQNPPSNYLEVASRLMIVSSQSGLSPQMIHERVIQPSLGYLSASGASFFQRVVHHSSSGASFFKRLFHHAYQLSESRRLQALLLEEPGVIGESSEEKASSASLRQRASQSPMHPPARPQGEAAHPLSSLPRSAIHKVWRVLDYMDTHPIAFWMWGCNICFLYTMVYIYLFC